MLQSGPHHVLEIRIIDAVGLDGPYVFVRQVDSRDTLVIRRERHGNSKLAVEWKGMIFRAHAENHIVTGEVDFYHHVIPRHLLQQLVGTIFVHHIHSMSDAFRLRLFDRKANVATQSLVRHESRGQLARMQAQMNLRIKRAEESDDVHVQPIIGHR